MRILQQVVLISITQPNSTAPNLAARWLFDVAVFAARRGKAGTAASAARYGRELLRGIESGMEHVVDPVLRGLCLLAIAYTECPETATPEAFIEDPIQAISECAQTDKRINYRAIISWINSPGLPVLYVRLLKAGGRRRKSRRWDDAATWCWAVMMQLARRAESHLVGTLPSDPADCAALALIGELDSYAHGSNLSRRFPSRWLELAKYELQVAGTACATHERFTELVLTTYQEARLAGASVEILRDILERWCDLLSAADVRKTDWVPARLLGAAAVGHGDEGLAARVARVVPHGSRPSGSQAIFISDEDLFTHLGFGSDFVISPVRKEIPAVLADRAHDNPSNRRSFLDLVSRFSRRPGEDAPVYGSSDD
jgi:hypothetical protein